jgi:hypothetical protein
MKQQSLKRLGVFLCASLFGAAPCGRVGADTFEWIAGNGTHNWADGSKWLRTQGSGAHAWPSFAGDVAIVTNGAVAGSYSANLTLNLGATPISVGVLRFRANFTVNTNAVGGRLVLDNLGARADLIQDNTLGSGNKTFNAPVEVVGSARLSSRHYSDILFAGGLIGNADSHVALGDVPNSSGNLYLRLNDQFAGTFRSTHSDSDLRGVILDRNSSLGAASRYVNGSNGCLTITYAIPNALMSRVTSEVGSKIRLDGAAASFTNVVNPSQYLPQGRSAEFRLSGAAGDKWANAETLRLGSTLFNVQTSEVIGDLVPYGAAGLAFSVGKALDCAGLGLERGGTLFMGNTVTNVSVGTAGAALDDVVPPSLRWSLDNGTVWLSPRLGFHDFPVKLTGSAAPWTLARFGAADLTAFEAAGPNDLADLTTNATLTANKTFAGLRLAGNTSLNVSGSPTPTVTVRNGHLGASFSGNVYANLVFGESSTDRRDGVIFWQSGGGSNSRFHGRITAADLYVAGTRNGWSNQYFHNATFDLAGDIFANIDDGCSINFDRGLGLASTIVNINSSGNGIARFYNVAVGGVRGIGRIGPVNYTTGAVLTLTNVVDCVHEGGVEDISASCALRIRKLGPAMQTFTGGIIATPGIDVYEGTLRLDGTTSSSAQVFVGASGAFPGGTLAGIGTVGTNVVLAAGGTLSPGGSVGTLTVMGVLQGTGGTLDVDLAAADSFDRVVVHGNAVLSGLEVDVTALDGYTPSSSAAFPVVTATGTLAADGVTVTGGYTVAVEGQSLVVRPIAPGTMSLVR